MREKLKTFGIVLLAVLALTLSMPMAQITVPNTFTTSVPVSQLNSNFSTIGSGALNRNGGTIAGNIAVDSGKTIDGVDISAVLGGTGTPTFSTLTLSSTSASALDVAGGINAGSGNVGIVDTTGKVPAISSTYFSSLSGANLTGIPAATALTNTWTSVAYNAANFTGGGGMTWGVDSGDQITFKYNVIGKLLTVIFYFSGTDVTAPVGTDLRVTIPGGYTAASNVRSSSLWYNDAPTEGTGLIVIGAGNTYMQFYKSNSGLNWTATAADNTAVAGSITFEIQ